MSNKVEDIKEAVEAIEEVIEEVKEGAEEVDSPDPKGNETIVYERGDAVIFCHVCNTISKLQGERYTNVEGGIQLPFLGTTNKDLMSFGCPKCGAMMSLGFIPSEIKEEENEDLPSNNKE